MERELGGLRGQRVKLVALGLTITLAASGGLPETSGPNSLGIGVAAAKPDNDGNDCTSLRDDKDGIYLGHACASKGDKFVMTGQQHFSDRPYGLIYIARDGVYKCAYVNPILPLLSSPPSSATEFCAKKQSQIDNRKIYKKINCPEENGSNTCGGPTFFTGIKPHCEGTKRSLYKNVNPPGRNILNVMSATGKNEFSGLITTNENVSHVQFRVKLKYTIGKDIPVAVVRSNNTDEKFGWGIMRFMCLKKHQLDGGPPDKD